MSKTPAYWQYHRNTQSFRFNLYLTKKNYTIIMFIRLQKLQNFKINSDFLLLNFQKTFETGSK